MKKYWLIKSEPNVYSIENLKKDKQTLWTGVRNYQARNFMMTEMSPGDLALFYHSNAEPPGIAGICKVSKVKIPDPTQFDKKSEYYDQKSTPANPRWFCAEFTFVKKAGQLISLEVLKSDSNLKDLTVTKRGQRLSVQPVTEVHFNYLEKLLGG